jgi:hypothetical protein
MIKHVSGSITYLDEEWDYDGDLVPYTEGDYNDPEEGGYIENLVLVNNGVNLWDYTKAALEEVHQKTVGMMEEELSQLIYNKHATK